MLAFARALGAEGKDNAEMIGQKGANRRVTAERNQQQIAGDNPPTEASSWTLLNNAGNRSPVAVR